MMIQRPFLIALVALVYGTCVTPEAVASDLEEATYTTGSYIVQGPNVGAVQQAVEHTGGEVDRTLAIINAVSATLTEREVVALEDKGFRVIDNGPVRTN